MGISALVCKYIRCFVMFEVLKALMLRIELFWVVAVTGSYIPEDGDGMILQAVRNQ